MKTVRRTLASLLSLLMVLSCCTVLFPVFAGAEGISFGWVTEWLDVDENGMWQSKAVVPDAERFDYQYAAKYENGNYYFGLKYTGKLTGTAESNGNGSGTNLRLWVRNPATGYVSYNYFFDVSWNGTSFITRLMRNTNAGGNKAALVYGYDAESYPYTVNWAQTETGAEIELIVPDTVIGAGYETRAIFSVSNKDVANYCLHSNNNDNAPASAWYAGDVVIIDDADFFEILGNTATIDKNNSSYGSNQIPADESYGTVSYESDEENLYIRVRYHGDLATNGEKYGNGNGAFVRVWFRDLDRMVDSQFKSYDYFLDVEYTPDGTRTRFLTNAKATKANEASVTYAYDAEKPYTVEGIVNEEAADGYKWEVRITMPISVISANGRWQFQPTLGFWGEHPGADGSTVTGYSSLTFGDNGAPYTEWVEASALPALPQWGDDILTGDITKINVNLDSVWMDKLVCDKVANYSGLLNDGVTAADGGAFSYGAPWYAYYINGEYTTLADPANRIGRATFDLGSSKPVSEIAMQVAPGVGEASSIKVYASLNNVNWLEIGELTYEGTAIQTINLVFDKEIEARYFKVEMVTKGMFFMVSEIMIYQYIETPYPGYFTEIDNPKFSELDNIASAEGTGVTYNSVDMTGTYTGNVTDGITGPTGYNNNWRGFRQGGNVVFDFGTTVENIGSVDIFTWPANKSGIVKPERIAVEASIDGKNWFTAYETTDFSAAKWNAKDDNVLKETIRFDKLLAGRYVRVTVSGGWVFVSEIQVNAHTEVADIAELSHTFAYATGSANVFTYGMGEKLGDVTEKRLQWWNLAACEYDPATGNFKVTEIRKGTGGEEDFRDMEIPEFGFVLGAHTAGDTKAPALARFINGLNVGDTVYLYGVDLTENTAKALGRACVRATPIEGETPVSAPVSVIKTLSGYAESDINIWIPFTKDGTTYNTPMAIRNALCDDTKNYAWYYVVVVDADGKITAINKTNGDKDMVIPEGGYAIGVHTASTDAIAIVNNANIGDTVCLYGLDLAENAGKSGALENAYFGVLHRHTMVPHVIPVTCTEDGYTYEDCVCGHRTANHDILPATGHDVEGQEVIVLDPTCGDIGYSYQICKNCSEEIVIEDTETQPTGKHQYSATVREADNGFFDFECIVCGESYIGNADGEEAVRFAVSHHNTYSWGSDGFGVTLITGEAGKTVNECVSGQYKYNAEYAGYVVERIGDHYVATSFVKSGAHELVIPENGFIIVVKAVHAKYGKYFTEGELLGNYILPTFVGSYGFGGAFAIDIGAYPEQTNWFYAVSPAEATHVESLGAKVNTVTKSLRFGATFTKGEGKVTSLGMLLIPEEKLGENVLDLEYAQANTLVANVRTMRIENYVDGQAFDDYETVTFTVTVNGLEGHEDAIICARPYVVYEDGTVEYGRLVLRSYEAVYETGRI